ncbi:hypothetical protein HTT03_02965 [Sulfitobacter sp. S0837]|uniref:hypothetical protein n=1 Tax=Sulfitobacter maritimus TaxID=2741719 RepID=UPI00158192FC|nr:hypothetical protein [Sulfitobacter maritimus]NUH64264.1 hypothetical protein [Sulfitobacter maritimus]
MNNYVMAAQAMAFRAGGAKADTRVAFRAKFTAQTRFQCHLTKTVPFQYRISL